MKPNRHLRILLAEDDDDHAQLLVRSLRDQRVSSDIDRVRDGVEAMEFLHRQSPYADKPRPDLVIVDINMPRMNGHELLAAIKSDSGLKSIPVVVLTTSDSETDRVQAYSLHANSYLIKPVEFDNFHKMATDMTFYWGIWNRPGE